MEVKVSVSMSSPPTPSRGLAQRQALRRWLPKRIPSDSLNPQNLSQ
jgi:hypothetical protein